MSTALEFLWREEVEGDQRQGDMKRRTDKMGLIRVDAHSLKMTSRQFIWL